MAHARQELKRIDEALTSPHLLIGGLAVQQYYQPRMSQDIDLVCPAGTAAALIERLYPTDRFIVRDQNDDVLRPAWVATERRRDGRSTYIGPKITERQPYQFVDYEWLLTRAAPYRVGGAELRNIFVPGLEAVAFMKLLALSTRLQDKPEKGEQDLRDFVNLTNLPNFQHNTLLDMIEESCEEYLATRIVQLSTSRAEPLFAGSSVARLSDLLFPVSQDVPSGPVRTVYSPDKALDFYARIADHYDQRNTRFLYDAHSSIISQLRTLLDSGNYIGVIDVGCGTGRLIASHFAFRNIKWIAIDGCQEMLNQFASHTSTDSAVMKPVIVKSDLQEYEFAHIPDGDGGNKWIALLSFVLTSMPDDTLLERLISGLSNLSAVVLADIHPLYTLKHPNYDFSLPGGDVDLSPRAVFPDILQEVLTKNNFRLTYSRSVKKGQHDPYAFIYVFESENQENSAATILDTFGSAGFGRFYLLIDVHHRYYLSVDDDRFLDCEYESHRIVHCQTQEGIAALPLSWSKSTDRHAPFDPANPPRIELVECTRSGPGAAQLSPPRRCSGASFVLDLRCDPPLRLGERIDFTVRGHFPKFKFANAADTRAATRGSAIGERPFELASWFVDFPVRNLSYTVTLPMGVGIKPMGPRSAYGDNFPAVPGPNADLNEDYSYREFSDDENQYFEMRLTVVNGKYKCRYRLAWSLPEARSRSNEVQ